tara:strand:+ start:2228 stop:2515 length:288 start_codon:yes stop_codon:yes gene_type:complete
MNFARKLKRSKLKRDAKNLKTAVKSVTKRLDSLGDKCKSCNKPFDKGDHGAMMSWSVYVVDGSPNLVCPTCKEEIERLKKEQAEVIDAEIIEEGS